MIEQSIDDFWSSLLHGTLPSAPDWVAVCLIIPQANLNKATESIEERNTAVLAGKDIMNSFSDGFYARISWTSYYGVVRGKIEDIRHTLATNLKKAVDAHKINALWQYDFAAIGNHLPRLVFDELSYHLQKGIPRTTDEFERDWSLGPGNFPAPMIVFRPGHSAESVGMFARNNKEFQKHILGISLPCEIDLTALILTIPSVSNGSKVLSDNEEDVALRSGEKILLTLKSGIYTKVGSAAFFGLTLGKIEDVKRIIEAALKKAKTDHKINKLWAVGMAPLGKRPPAKIFQELESNLLNKTSLSESLFRFD